MMAELRRQREDEAYRIYVTDALRIIGENTAKMTGGRYLSRRFADVIHPDPEENRTPEEIIEAIRKKLKEVG